MEKNVTIAKGYMNFGSSKEEYTNLWNGISDQLNSLGPPVRTTPEWQKVIYMFNTRPIKHDYSYKVWNDYKAKVKAKLGQNKKELKATGGGCNKLFTFSSQEESVIDILMLREVSQPSRKTFGLGSSSENAGQSITTETLCRSPLQIDSPRSPAINQNTNLERELEYSWDNRLEETDLPPEPTITKSKGSGSKKAHEARLDERNRLLIEQTESIKETERHTKEIARYTRKMYDIKSKKLKVMQENLMEQRKYRKEKLDIKLREIEYKERKLALLMERPSKENEY